MILQIVLLFLGFGFLIRGSDWLVDGASELARKHNVSDLAIGLTIVAFGTSAPEMVVNVYASFQGHHDLVFGNVIGSNNFNLFVILGIAGLVTPMIIQSGTVWKEIPLSFLAVVVLYVMGNGILSSGGNIISRFDGLILLMLFALFLFYVFRQLNSTPSAPGADGRRGFSTLKIWGFILGGLAGLIIGGRLIVTSSVQIAADMGVGEKVIGLTIVAAGTSLPELATSVVAAIRKNNDIAVGNIIGSNIFNIFLILGISSLIRPLEYDAVFNQDLLLLSGGTMFLFLAMFTGKRKKLDRWEAAVFLLVFIFYTFYLIQNSN